MKKCRNIVLWILLVSSSWGYAVESTERSEVPAPHEDASQENVSNLDKSESGTRVIASSSSRSSYFSLNLGYLISPKVEIEGDVWLPGVREFGSITYRFKDSLKVGIEWSQFQKRSWNSGFLLDYTDLKFDEIVIKGGSGSASGSIDNGGISIITLAYAGKYRWDRFYLPALIGYSMSDTYNGGLFEETMKTRLYLSTGAGVSLTEMFNIELLWSTHTLTSKSVSTDQETLVPKKIGYLNNLQLNLKILF